MRKVALLFILFSTLVSAKVFKASDNPQYMGINPTAASVDSSGGGSCKNKEVGYIYVTFDSKTSSYKHGHAGIGSCKDGYVLESNPSTSSSKNGVQLYETEHNYWTAQKRKTGGIYKVKKATSSDYKKAYDKGSAYIGKPYGLSPGTSTSSFYCSELVARAWDRAGFDLSNTSTYKNGGYVTPKQLTTDSDTYVWKSF